MHKVPPITKRFFGSFPVHLLMGKTKSAKLYRKTPLIFVCSFFAGTGISSGSNGNMFGNFARWNEPSTPSLSMSKKVYSHDVGGSSEKMPPGPSNKKLLHIQVLDSGEYILSRARQRNKTLWGIDTVLSTQAWHSPALSYVINCILHFRYTIQ